MDAITDGFSLQHALSERDALQDLLNGLTEARQRANSPALDYVELEWKVADMAYVSVLGQLDEMIGVVNRELDEHKEAIARYGQGDPADYYPPRNHNGARL